MSVLKQLEESGASKMLEVRHLGGCSYQFTDVPGTLKFNDPRFLEDDLNTLVEYGLLRHEISSQGNNVYCFTRKASALVREIED